MVCGEIAEFGGLLVIFCVGRRVRKTLSEQGVHLGDWDMRHRCNMI